jgi:predicted ribosome quality control (RQC) complex YloA/Tae2 family protein
MCRNKAALIEAWNTRSTLEQPTNDVPEGTSLSPFEYSNDRMVNFFPKANGEIVRIAARRNAICIDYYDEYVDSSGNRKRVVSVECKDEHMKDFLILKAQEIVNQQPTNDVERVAGIIESNQLFLDTVSVEGDEDAWKSALRRVATECLATLTQKHDTTERQEI